MKNGILLVWLMFIPGFLLAGVSLMDVCTIQDVSSDFSQVDAASIYVENPDGHNIFTGYSKSLDTPFSGRVVMYYGNGSNAQMIPTNSQENFLCAIKRLRRKDYTSIVFSAAFCDCEAVIQAGHHYEVTYNRDR